MKLEWKDPVNEPGVERQEFASLGYLPGKGYGQSLYWIWDFAAYEYSASLVHAPYTALGTRYSLEQAKALCEQHAEEHLHDYVLPTQAEFDRARADSKRGDKLPRPAAPPSPRAADLPRPSDRRPGR